MTTSSPRTVRIATIGTSMITRRFAAAAADADGIELTHVYSRDPARAAAVATELGVPGWSSDLAALLACDAVDAVYVASPNSLHYPQARDALLAGKHVLVEKPATTSETQTAGLVELARDSGLVFLEAIRSLYDPGYALIRQTIATLGPIRRVSLCFHQRSARYDQVLAGGRVNVFDPALGGGALNDLGIYCVHALTDLFGEPTRVSAELVAIPGGTDGAGAVLAAYPGFVADLSFSKITAPGLPSVIEGEAASLVIDRLDDPRRLTLRPLDGAPQELLVTKRGEDQLANLLDCVERFAAAVTSRVEIAADQERSIATARLMDRVRQAATHGR